MTIIHLLDGTRVRRPLDRLRRFCAVEYAYYDALPQGDPNHIEPADVLATVAVNSFVNSAAQIRRVHRGLAEACNEFLPRIPRDAHLLTFDPELQQLLALLQRAVQVPGVLVAVATKVLHRKRPAFIPMLDRVILDHYLGASGNARLIGALQDKRRAAASAIVAAEAFRQHLRREQLAIAALRRRLAPAGYALSDVRLLEALVWTELEDRGYYRIASVTG